MIKLSPLDPNKTVIFYSPIEGNDILVRTGVLQDKSTVNSFIHSVLHAYSSDYPALDQRGKEKLAKHILGSVTSRLKDSMWEKTAKGVVGKLSIQEEFLDALEGVYSCEKANLKPLSLSEKEEQGWRILTGQLEFKKCEKVVKNTFDKNTEEDLNTTREEVVRSILKEFDRVLRDLDDKRKKFFSELVSKVVKFTFDNVSTAVKSNYNPIDKNEDVIELEIDQNFVKAVEEKFNRDIYIIDAKERLPFVLDTSNKSSRKKAIILLSIGGIKYEVIGRLLPQQRVQREFYTEDPLITRMRTFVYEPEKVVEKYPNLIAYLPKEYRTKDVTVPSKSDSSSSESKEVEQVKPVEKKVEREEVKKEVKKEEKGEEKGEKKEVIEEKGEKKVEKRERRKRRESTSSSSSSSSSTSSSD